MCPILARSNSMMWVWWILGRVYISDLKGHVSEMSPINEFSMIFIFMARMCFNVLMYNYSYFVRVRLFWVCLMRLLCIWLDLTWTYNWFVLISNKFIRLVVLGSHLHFDWAINMDRTDFLFWTNSTFIQGTFSSNSWIKMCEIDDIGKSCILEWPRFVVMCINAMLFSKCIWPWKLPMRLLLLTRSYHHGGVFVFFCFTRWFQSLPVQP
jgi:hypothetical protein